jgi:hypothetical protein
MSEEKQNSAEIDLLYFFKPIGTLFRKIGNFINYCFYRIKANIIGFGIIVLVITGAGYSLRYFITPAYQTEGIFISNILPGNYCSLLLKNLNKLKGGENDLALANQLKIGSDAAKDIQSIRMAAMRDTFLIERKDSTLSLFKITLTLRSLEYLDTIQWALVNYLESNEYAEKRKDAKRKALLALKANLSSRMESIDSLKKIVTSSIIPRSEARGIIYGEPLDPVTVYQAEINYIREQINIDQALATIDNIEILQPFLKIGRPNYPDFNRLLIYYFLGALILASLIMLLFGRKPKF